MSFAIILKKLRKEHQMTQEELARLLNVAKSTVSMYEQGERMPSFDIMESLANIFNVSIDVLYGRETKRVKKTSEELKIALFSGDSQVPDEMLNKVLEYAALLKLQYDKNNKE